MNGHVWNRAVYQHKGLAMHDSTCEWPPPMEKLWMCIHFGAVNVVHSKSIGL